MSIRSMMLAVLLIPGLVAPYAVAQDPWPTKAWPTAAPESVGLDSGILAAFESDIGAGKYGYVDSLLVIRRGRLVVDRSWAHDYDKIYGRLAREQGPLNAHDPSGPYNYFNPWWHPFYRRGHLHSLQSVTKTMTSVIIGAAAARGEFPALETPVLKFFDESKVANVDARKRRLTIRHLLT
ncbi:MAG: serine hydrolase, partial [Acidobacteriota bacterium]